MSLLIPDQTFVIYENASNGTTVGKIVYTESDPNATVTFTILDVTPFIMDGDDIKVADSTQLDWETIDRYRFRVRGVDSNSYPTNATMTVNIKNINESPTFIGPFEFTKESVSSGDVIGEVEFTDPEFDTCSVHITTGVPFAVSVTQPTSNTNGKITITATQDVFNSYTFSLTISDGEYTTSSNIKVNITPRVIIEPSNIGLVFNKFATWGGKALQFVVSEPVDPYNPLGLPANTIRVKFSSGYTPTMGDSQTLVDSTNNVWDIYKQNYGWSNFFSRNTNLLEVLGANTSNVIRMDNMFYRCSNLTSVALFDTSNVTSMSMLFGGCNITSIPLFDTSNVTNMMDMFRDCSNLTSVPLFNTSNVTTMYSMFEHCGNLTSVPLFNTSKVTNMTAMFAGCTHLTTVPLFDTSNVTSMERMFFNCGNLTSVPLFNTAKVTTMGNMFDTCTSLTTSPLFNTSNVTNMDGMFSHCASLTTVPLFDTSKVTGMLATFYGCTNVQSGALALYQQASTQTNPPTNHTRTFYNCGRDTQTGAAELAQIPASWKE